MTVTPAETFPLGPGTLTIGATGTPIDVSCLINNALISADKDEGDAVTKLCGDVVPGAVKYTYTLGGNIDLDIAEESGLWALSQSSAGQQVEFTFTPNTDAGTAGAGKLVLDPLPFGGEESGETMAGDFEFTIVGAPSYTFTGGAVLTAPVKVRGVPYNPDHEDEPKPTGKRSRKADPVGADA
jgi:hypothetical protein